MRLIFSVLTAIIVIVAAIVFIGPLFVSAEDVRNQILAQVESTTGYRLRISGPVDITLFPSLNFVAEDVGVAQPAVSGESEFATAKTLKFGLMLRGLLDGKMRVTEVTLIEPVIALPKSPAKPQSGGAQGAPDAAPASGGGGGGIGETLKNLTLDEVIIKNGTVILPPSGNAPGKRIEKLDLEAALPAFDKPLSFDVSAVFDGKAIKANGSVGNFGQFLEGAPAPVSLAVEAPGTLDAKATLVATATYKDDTLTLTQFSAKSGDKTLAGLAVYKDDTVTLSQVTATAGRDTFAGNAVYKNNVVTLSHMRANVRGNVLAGSATINLANKVPHVVAELAAKTLDVNALMGSPKSKSKSKSSGGGGGAGGGGGSGRGQTSAGWSNAKIDFSPLRLINGELSLSAEQLIYDQMKINPVTVQAVLNGGKLNATLSKFQLYAGGGDITIAVDASSKVPAQRIKLSLANFNAYNLLKDASGFQRIEGRGSVALDLNARGASQRAIVGALNGNANFEFANGAIRGMNIAQMMRNLGSGVVNGWQGGATEKTDFASLGASFTVVKGRATTKDLHLAGPLVRLTGTGEVNLPAKSLKFRIDPQLVASLKGQGGEKDIAGLGVPIMIVGPWAKPKIYPDIKGILQDPAAAYERFKQFGDEVKTLPGLEKIDKNGVLSNVIKDGKVDEDALIEGLGGLFNKNQPAAVQPNAAPTAPDAAAAPKKKSSRKGIEDAAKQLLNDFLQGQ
ncbi:MAG: AsmA family protein [Hyphomicrobiaceae bacterium]|nr:AsmA family protein [Hyphomicrobiaceae bacterium]MDX2449491.1 AsmA family protein [Hyphomicrobiaceae bacterium]